MLIKKSIRFCAKNRTFDWPKLSKKAIIKCLLGCQFFYLETLLAGTFATKPESTAASLLKRL